MKLNLAKADTYGITNLNGIIYRYGWYHSGRAFVAKEDEVMTFAEAFKELVPKCSFNLYNAFFVGTTRYKMTIDGIVRYMIDKNNR